MTGEILPFSPYVSKPEGAKLRVASIKKPRGSNAATNHLARVIPFVPGKSDTGNQTPTDSSDTPKILRFTPAEDWTSWAKEETYFERNLRLKITNTILTAILSDDLFLLERSPDKFMREIVNSIDKPNPQIKPANVGDNATSIIRRIERTIMELGRMEKEELKKLPPNKKRILTTLNHIFDIRIRDARDMGQEIGPGEVIIKLMEQIEEHFSPNPTSFPEL